MKDNLFSRLSLFSMLFAFAMTVTLSGAPMDGKHKNFGAFSELMSLDQHVFSGQFDWQETAAVFKTKDSQALNLDGIESVFKIQADYCDAVISSGCDDDALDRFSLTHESGTVEFNDGCAAGTYVDMTGTVLDMNAAVSYAGTAGSDSIFSESLAIWVDVNQDGDFGEEEKLVAVAGIHEFDKDFTLILPPDSLGGETRMRVVQSYGVNPPPSPCTITWGQILDFTVNITPAEACSGEPNPGESTGPTSICDGFSFDLSNTGASEGVSGLTYQWQSSPAGAGAWTDIEGANSASYTVADGISEATDFRYVVGCDNSGESAASNTVSIEMNPESECHCIPEQGGSVNATINNFSLGDFSNDSDNVKYGDFTDLGPIELATGVGYTASITVGPDSGNHGAAIWIDLNDDGVFDNAEMVAWLPNEIGAGSTVDFPEFVISGFEGLHKLRVMYAWNQSGDAMNPCDIGNLYGEAEDYMVDVIAGEPCEGVPDSGEIFGPESICAGVAFTLTNEGASSGVSGLTYQWQSSAVGAEEWEDIEGAVFTSYYAANGIADATDFRMVISCTDSGEFSATNTLTITLEPYLDCYCIPAFASSSDQINNFSIGDFSNDSTSDDAENGYSDFTDLGPIELALNTEYIASITTSAGTGNHGVSLWIDLNDDGLFSESERLATVSFVQANETAELSPFTLTEGEGLHRMRVVYQFNVEGGVVSPCAEASYGEAEDYMVQIGGSEPPVDSPDCDQGDDSNNFENGYNITTGSPFRNADDFFVTTDAPLHIEQVELNIFASSPITGLNLVFFEDEGGVPGAEIENLSNVPVQASVDIGTEFGMTVYAVFADVDLTFTEGHYWMQAEVVNTSAYWEVTTAGSLGNPMATSEDFGPWEHAGDGSHAVFKLHCSPVPPPPPGPCELEILLAEPITRVIMADVDNSSSPSSTEGYEDFTHIVIHAGAGESYTFAAEGYTGGDWENFFTVFIDTSGDEEEDWASYLTYEIGSIQDSTGEDGQQAVNQIDLPESLADGDYTLRVIKNFNESPLSPCGNYTFGQAEDYTLNIGEVIPDSPDCGQGDDSNEFENGFNIVAGGAFRNADDFFVSTEAPLHIQQVELNIFSDAPITSINLTFFEDDGGVPGDVIETLNNVEVQSSTPVGENFGFDVYTVLALIDVTFTEGSYWMQPEANAGTAFWEVTTAGSLGSPVVTSEDFGPWNSDVDGSHGVFKLHCTPVPPPPPAPCNLSISIVEPITRVIMADVDNSSPVNSTDPHEDFTDIVIHAEAGGSYTFAAEGTTEGPYTNYFTVFIDTSAEGNWAEYLTYEIDFIEGSTGNDGQQAINVIDLPASMADGDYTLRVIKNYFDSPMNPCGTYTWGQAEDYTLNIGDVFTPGECSQGIPSFETVPNAYRITDGSTFRIADDFIVEDGTSFTMNKITIDVNNVEVPTSATINIHEDNGGTPGDIIHTIITAPDESTIVGVAFDEPIHHLVFNLAETLEFGPGTYWMAPQMSNPDGSDVWWAATDEATHGAFPSSSSDDGVTWTTGFITLSMVATFSGHCDTLGIVDDLNSFDFTYYPNPVNDVLNIKSSKKVESVQAFNLAGQQVMNNAKGLNASNQIDVTRLPAGVYIFRAVLADGQVETFKVIKK